MSPFFSLGDQDLSLSAGRVVDINLKDQSFGFNGTTKPGDCGGVYIHQETGRVVGIHYMGHHDPIKPNRGIIAPKN